MKNSIFTSILFTTLILMSCGSDDASDCTQAQFSSEVNAAITGVNNAGTAWANDPSSANCNAFVSAANDYLDVVEGFNGCGVISQSDYDSQIDAARAAINTLPGC